MVHREHLRAVPAGLRHPAGHAGGGHGLVRRQAVAQFLFDEVADHPLALGAEDVAEVVRFVVETPAHVCLNEIWVTPTHNRGYIAQLGRGS